jgi:hypothetical protein
MNTKTSRSAERLARLLKSMKTGEECSVASNPNHSTHISLPTLKAAERRGEISIRSEGWKGNRSQGWTITKLPAGVESETKSHVPGVRLDISLESIGYQVDVSVDGKHVGTWCRDFATDRDVDAAKVDLAAQLVKLIEKWGR